MVEINLNKLNKIKKALEDHYVVRVGILGAKADQEHKGTDMTNAEIGAIHELGSISQNIPARSFIKMPIRDYLKKVIKEKGLIKKYYQYAQNGKLREWYANLGFEAENVIHDAFQTEGFGKWEALQPETIRRKGSSKPLIDTGQLESSIASEVINEDS